MELLGDPKNVQVATFRVDVTGSTQDDMDCKNVDFGFENMQQENGEELWTELWVYSLQDSKQCKVKSQDYEVVKESALYFEKIEFTD